MVFFTCNACGQAVKKNQVEKHYTTKCRNCTVLSCIDCGKEFCGDEYQGHVKCVTENEKYGAKDTKDIKPKPSSTKGEAKQVNWLENIKNYIAATNLPQRISSLLNDLLKYNNIPRKKQQFQNFLSNSVRIRDKNLSEEIWEIITKANQSEGSSKAAEVKDEAQVESKTGQPELENGNLSHADVAPTETVKHKKKKRKDKNEEAQKTEDNEPAEEQEAVKKHKRKHKDVTQEEENLVTSELVQEMASHESSDKKSKKHKKRRKEEPAEEQVTLVNNEAAEDDLTNGNAIKKHKKKRRESEVDAVSDEIEPNSKDGASQNSPDAENDNVQDCAVETTDMVKTPKKKKNKKHKKHDDLTDNMMNGNESVAIEEQELKPKKAKQQSDKNHADKADNVEQTAGNNEHHAEGENLYKKKKKKCK